MPYSNEEIRTLVESYDLSKTIQKDVLQEPKRESFVKDYSIDRIKGLTLDEYVCGKKKAGNEDYSTFCYRIEFELNELGSMKGGSSLKFGIYYNTDTHDYKFSSKFGTSTDEAFSNVKDAIVSLLNAAEKENFKTIEENLLSDIFKYKLISTYYPKRYLPIFNIKHIEIFLDELGISYTKGETFMEKQEKLRLYKESNSLFQPWPLITYMHFLYDSILSHGQSVKYAAEKQRRDDKDYSTKYKSGIDISKEQWQEMLHDKSIFSESDTAFLCQLYKENNHASTCYEIALKNGVSPHSYNSPMINLAKRVLKNLGRKPEKNEEGGGRFWNVLFMGKRLPDGHYEWKLRPELADALSSGYQTSCEEAINDELDSELAKDISINPIKINPKGIKDIKRDKPEPTVIRGVLAYPRNRTYALTALNNANHQCEVDSSHTTFIRRADKLPYTEPHHLIPMAMQGRYSVSIDVPENIVSLCSNCHNEIHYGDNAEKLLTRLYEERKEYLKNKAGITITLDELLSYYK